MDDKKLADVLLDIHVGDPEIDSLIITAANRVEELEAEIAKLKDYIYLLEQGLSAHEARATVWGEEE